MILTYLLEHTGFRWTLRIWSGILLVFGGICIIGVKPRLPPAPASQLGPVVPVDWRFLKTPLFVVLVRASAFLEAPHAKYLNKAVAVLVQGLGTFCVSLVRDILLTIYDRY